MLRSYLAVLALIRAQTVLIEQAEELSGNDAVRHLRGAVILRQDTLRLFCDEAELHSNNAFTARGAVRTFIGESGLIKAQLLTYDPATRQLIYEGQVAATFRTTTLRAPRLTYDRNTETAFYTGGGSLSDTSGTIHSLEATYHLPSELATFAGQVRVEHPPYIAFSESLYYRTDSAIATFPIPFILYNHNQPETLSAQTGLWRREEGLITISQKVQWRTPDLLLKAEYALYNQLADTGYAACEVFYKSRSGKGWGIADSAFWHSDTLTLRENVAAFLLREEDTLFVQAHTALLYSPSLYLIGEAVLLRPPLHATADSMQYDTLARTLHLYGNAWLLAYPYQLFARTLRLTLPHQAPDSLYAFGDVHVVSEADTFLRFYQQVRSDSLTAKWDTSLRAFSPLHFARSLRAIYYQSEGPHWQGAHEILSAAHLHLALGPNRQPTYLRLESQPYGRFLPIKKLLGQPLFLSSFQWRPPENQPHWPLSP